MSFLYGHILTKLISVSFFKLVYTNAVFRCKMKTGNKWHRSIAGMPFQNTGRKGDLMYENIQEGQYLIKLISSAINNTPLKMPADDLNWDNLYHLASFHNVANTAYYSLLKFPDSSIIPKNIWEKFSADAKKFSALEALQHFEIRQVLLQFERNKIFCTPLSGYMMKPLYPRPDMRYSATLDLFIHAAEKEAVDKLMASLGYSSIRSTNTTVTYFKAPNMTIQFCTLLLPGNSKYHTYFDEVIKTFLRPEKGLQYIHTMTKEDFYIYLITYLAHEYTAGGASIRSILDIWMYLKRYNSILNRELISGELNKLNLGLFSFYMEELAWIWFGGGETFHNQSLYEKMEQQIFSLTKPAAAKETLSNAEAKPMPADEQEKIFLSLDVMADRYPILQKMPFLLPIFWLTRLSFVLLSKAVPPKKD